MNKSITQATQNDKQISNLYQKFLQDSMFERNRSKKVELLARVYDHAKHAYRFWFRMLTLGWSNGSTFMPVNSILLSTENRQNRINEATKNCWLQTQKAFHGKGTQRM